MRRQHARAGVRRENGSILIIVAVMALMLFALTAWAVDGSRVYQMASTVQATADAASLAAAKLLPDQTAAKAAAMSYATKNMDPTVHGTVIDSGDVIFGNWDFDVRVFTPTNVVSQVNAVKVTANRNNSNNNALPLIFAKAIGVSSAEIARSAVAAYSSQKPWDLLLVQDVTGSFVAELNDAKAADHALLDCFAAGAPPTSLFGINVFTGWSKVQAAPIAIGPGYATLNTAVNNIKSCGSVGAPICSGTDIAAGLEGGVNALVPVSSGIGVDKAIVLVTDGQPEPSPNGSHPGMTANQLKALATQWADNADAADISVFVVFYDGDNNAAAKAFLATLVRGDGIFLSTPDASKLDELLGGICNKLIKLQLVD